MQVSSEKLSRLVRVSELETRVAQIDRDIQGFQYPSEYGETAWPVPLGYGTDFSECFSAEPTCIKQLAEPDANLRFG
jgi:hypothetical protein